MFAGYALLMFFATVLAVGYYIFLFVIKCAKKLYHKLFPEKVVVPKRVYKLMHYFDTVGVFDTYQEAFEKGCSLIFKDMQGIFSDRLNYFTSKEKWESTGYSIEFNSLFPDYFYVSFDRISCGNYEKMRPAELMGEVH